MNKLDQNIGATGEIKAEFYDQSNLAEWQVALNKVLLKCRKYQPSIMKLYQLGQLVRAEEIKNVICANGFNAVARRLAGDTTYTGIINKMILGTGSGTPAETDTQLFTETYRNNTASATASGKVSYLTGYFTETECVGTYTEFGNCIDGLAGANTGQLWSHIAGLNWVKTNTVVLVVSCKYTLLNA
ncbi:MAG: hypothetical protein WCG01_02335 [bacterium]